MQAKRKFRVAKALLKQHSRLRMHLWRDRLQELARAGMDGKPPHQTAMLWHIYRQPTIGNFGLQKPTCSLAGNVIAADSSAADQVCLPPHLQEAGQPLWSLSSGSLV